MLPRLRVPVVVPGSSLEYRPERGFHRFEVCGISSSLHSHYLLLTEMVPGALRDRGLQYQGERRRRRIVFRPAAVMHALPVSLLPWRSTCLAVIALITAVSVCVRAWVRSKLEIALSTSDVRTFARLEISLGLIVFSLESIACLLDVARDRVRGGDET